MEYPEGSVGKLTIVDPTTKAVIHDITVRRMDRRFAVGLAKELKERRVDNEAGEGPIVTAELLVAEWRDGDGNVVEPRVWLGLVDQYDVLLVKILETGLNVSRDFNKRWLLRSEPEARTLRVFERGATSPTFTITAKRMDRRFDALFAKAAANSKGKPAPASAEARPLKGQMLVESWADAKGEEVAPEVWQSLLDENDILLDGVLALGNAINEHFNAGLAVALGNS